MKIFYTIILLSLTVLTSSSYAVSDSVNHKFGFYGGINYNLHTADFYKLRDIPNCCPDFESGSGIGINAGILYELRLTNSLWLGAKLGMMTFDGLLTKDETTTIIIESGPVSGTFEHEMEGKFMNIGLEPTLNYNLFSGFYLFGGGRIGMNMTSTYDQKETVVGYGTFADEDGNDTFSSVRNDLDGDIPDAVSMQFGAVAGGFYEFPLNKKGDWLFAPEVSYYLPFTELVENTDWKVSSLRAGIALKYAPIPKPPKEEIFEKEIKIDTIQIENDLITENRFSIGNENVKTETFETKTQIINTEYITRTDTLFKVKKYLLDGNITAVGVDENGNEIPNPVFTIEEFVSNRLDPLLNYVFFENNSSEIPKRYMKLNNSEAGDFEINDLFRESTLDIYYNVLNIVGRRMTTNPDATITLVGCNSNLDEEKGNLELSENRAKEVKNYLVDVWNIDESRIKTESRNLPEQASTPIEEADKTQENRRVEIYSDSYEILEPVFIEKIDRTANPPIARFKPEANSEAGLKSWRIEAYQQSRDENKYEYSENTDELKNVDWKLENTQKIIPQNPEPIIYSLNLEDTKGNTKEIKNKTLPIEVLTIQKKRMQKIGDYETEKFSLILFDFDKATIEGNNRKILDFIKSRTSSNSEIEINGYTDRTGNADYNKKLSERRAKSTKDALGNNSATYQGIGEEQLLYNNDIPEGRFYCRTVVVTVKTRIE